MPDNYLREDLFPGELDYFKANPHVAGMAAEDDRVILNPFSKLSAEQMQSVIKNETVRIKIRNSQNRPTFGVTDAQRRYFRGTPYERDEQAMRETIAARIFAGDPSVSDPTPEQVRYVRGLK